ncbi:hypothetical protein Tco_0117582 [Tanacetum coccineum]
MILDDPIARGQADPDKVLRKSDRYDEDTSVGPNQGKKTKRSRTKESEPSKKSSTSKESSKGTHFYELLKGTCTSSIELEYNLEECFRALTDKLDWNNPKGDRCPFDLTKPLPLKGRPGRLTVAAKYFYINDQEFLKSSDLEKRYTMSITKIKATQYEIVGIKDMNLTLLSTTKIGYNKDAEKGIKHWGDKGPDRTGDQTRTGPGRPDHSDYVPGKRFGPFWSSVRFGLGQSILVLGPCSPLDRNSTNSPSTKYTYTQKDISRSFYKSVVPIVKVKKCYGYASLGKRSW